MLEAKNEPAILDEAIQEAKLPSFVKEVKKEFDIDSVGDPSVLLYVIVSDSAAKKKNFFTLASEIRDRLGDSIQHSGLNRWPYIRFRTESEEKALETEEQN